MMYQHIKGSIFIALLFSIWSFSLVGQEDAHYWTHQYGAKGLLLNGAVIANSDAETSIFYNPGGMALSDNVGFAFSFLTPTYSRLDNLNYVGTGNTISDEGIGLTPGFIAVTYKPFKEEKIIIGAATFKRFNTDIAYNERAVGSLIAGDFFLYRANLDFERKVSEDWYGISIAYSLTDKIGIGISQFSVWHGEGVRFGFKKEIVPGSAPNNILQSWRYELDYDLSINSAFTTKLGFNYRSEEISLGLTLTSPLYGIVNTNFHYSFDDQRINSNDDIITAISNNRDLPLNDFKAPASIGAGVDILLNTKFKLSFSTEYFWPTEEIIYVEDTDDIFDGFGRSEPIESFFGISTKKNSVLNVAAGFQYKRNEKVQWLGGIRTDFSEKSSYVINNETEYIGTGPSIINLSGGGTFNFEKNVFSCGLNLGYGKSSNRRQLVDLSNINSDNIYEFSANNNVESKFFSVMLFVTYDFIFSAL